MRGSGHLSDSVIRFSRRKSCPGRQDPSPSSPCAGGMPNNCWTVALSFAAPFPQKQPSPPHALLGPGGEIWPSLAFLTSANDAPPCGWSAAVCRLGSIRPGSQPIADRKAAAFRQYMRKRLFHPPAGNLWRRLGKPAWTMHQPAAHQQRQPPDGSAGESLYPGWETARPPARRST
jgi:hypothetical protein